MAQGLWIDTVRVGLAAARPVTADPPPDGFVFYYASDTGELSMWPYGGSAWQDVGTLATGLQLAANAGTAGTGVEVTSVEPVATRKVTLTLDAVEVTVLEANDYGSAELYTFPDRNIMILGCETDLVITKGNAMNGIGSATDLDVSLGTAAADATTLADAMLDVMPKQDIDANSLTPDFNAHSLAAVPVLTGIPDAADNKLYFNVVAIGGITADDTVSLTGTITLFFIDLGNITS